MLHRLDVTLFGIHKRTVLNFPDKGVICFVGKNGSGKSLLVEALLWCLYGRCLRATQRWTPVRKGSRVRAEFASMTVDRQSERSTGALSVDGVTMDSAAVGADRIAALFGTFRYVTSARIFHKATTGKFAYGSDAHRRSVLESLVGEGIFQASEQLALELHQKALSAKAEALTAFLRATANLDAIVTPLGEKVCSPLGLLEADVEHCARLVSALEAALPLKPIEPLWSVRDLEKTVNKHDAQLSALKKRFRQVESARGEGKCPLCGSAWGSSADMFVSLLAGEIEVEEESLACARSELAERSAEGRKLWSAYKIAHVEYIRQQVRLEEARRELKRRRASVAAACSLRRDAVSGLEQDKARASVLYNRAGRRGKEAAAMRIVFGDRGARLALLEQCATVASEEATDVVQALRGSGSITLCVLENGRVTVEADFGVGSVPYVGLSAGEQAVTDIALVKAFAALPGGGQSPFPLVYDDVLQAMDSEVTRGVADFIEDEAEDHQVFVLAPSESAIECFSDPTIFHLNNGEII